MIFPNGAIVAVMDGTRLQLFRNTGHETHIELTALPAPDLKAGHGGSGGRHHSSSANPDSHRLAEDDFAAAAAGYLNNEALTTKMTGLLVIADPRSLGEVRKHFHPALTEKLLGEIHHDLIDHPVEAIKAAIVAA